MPYVESPPRKATKEERQLIESALRFRFPGQFDDWEAEEENFSAIERILVVDDYTTDSPGYSGKVAYVTWGLGPEFITILHREQDGEGDYIWVHAFTHWDGLLVFGSGWSGEFDRNFEVEYSGADHA